MKKRQGSSLILISLLAIGIVLVGGIVLVAVRNPQTPASFSDQSTTTSEVQLNQRTTPESGVEVPKSKLFTDKRKLIRFEYPPAWEVRDEDQNRDSDQFVIEFDKVPNDRAQLHGRIVAVKTDSAYCYLGLCEELNTNKGVNEKLGNNEWLHLTKPLVCAADACPTNSEVYRITNESWTYYAIFGSTQDAESVLRTLDFI